MGKTVANVVENWHSSWQSKTFLISTLVKSPIPVIDAVGHEAVLVYHVTCALLVEIFHLWRRHLVQLASFGLNQSVASAVFDNQVKHYVLFSARRGSPV